MIDVAHLTFQFDHTDRPALDDISLHVEAGEFVVLTGPSGCGKSTLALALGGYLFRQFAGRAEGTVWVAGIDVRRSAVYDVAEVVGLVQQNPENQFCTLTVADEVAFGLENRCLPPAEIVERVDWALGVVGARHLAHRLLSTLSGGEKQKVAIAAMMAAHPRVLIFDEPTSNLDPTATAAVFEAIARIRRQQAIVDKLTVIVIEHKVRYLRQLALGESADKVHPFVPRIVGMDAGRIVSDGEGGMASCPRLKSPLRTRLVVATSVASSPLRIGEGEMAISVRDLCVCYEDGVLVLRNVTVDIPHGQFVAVMGDNGVGKSTFLHCLLGLAKPTSGTVTVLGLDTRRTPVSELARRVGFLFQNPDHQIFAETVWKEATFATHNFGLGARYDALSAALLERSGLGEYLDRHPYRLSYGQKRRLNLISVLPFAEVLLLDEVLIGQDAENVAALMGQLRDAADSGVTVVSVTHHPESTWRYADRVLFFAAGGPIVDAPPREAFAQLAERGYTAYTLV